MRRQGIYVNGERIQADTTQGDQDIAVRPRRRDLPGMPLLWLPHLRGLQARERSAMKPAIYYNEFDKQKAAWLRELMARDIIAPGDVDERSIRDVRADDLRGYVQCHFFAGIGIWSYALRLGGWEDGRPVWTASCPCQPFSDAGKKEAFDDERHLWPVLFPLIRARRPLVCIGEQVASLDGLAWFDTVHADLGNAGYTPGAIDLCAAGFGSPHRRQRLYWLAYAEGARGRAGSRDRRSASVGRLLGRNGDRVSGMADPDEGRRRRRPYATGRGDSDGTSAGRFEGDGVARWRGEVRLVDNSEGARPQDGIGRGVLPRTDGRPSAGLEQASPTCIVDNAASGRQQGRDGSGEYLRRSLDGRPEGSMADTDGRGRGELGHAALSRGRRHHDGGSEPRQLDNAEPYGRDARRGLGDHAGNDGVFPLATGDDVRMADADREPGRPEHGEESGGRGRAASDLDTEPRSTGSDGGVADTEGEDGQVPVCESGERPGREATEFGRASRPGPINGFWRDADWVLTRPQRVGDPPGIRPVEAGTFPLADGATARLGRLRGYGDGIVAPVAVAFVEAVVAILDEA